MANASDQATTEVQRHILLVDDSEPDRLLARAALRQSGVPLKLDCLDNGRAAIIWLAAREQAAETRPILVLLDMRMPDWDGLRTFEEIRRHPRIGSTPVVFLTALETHDTGPMYEADVNAYVVKPASLPGLIKFFKDLDGFWYDHITQGDVIGAKMPTT
ncbi:MAG: response regulator [Nevskia sp.]|nr:response regulator [Nevskia sp.]